MDLYREQLLDHYHHPRGWGLVEGADVEQEAYSQACGDTLTVQAVLDRDMVKEFHFTGHGCAISLAAASLLSEYLPGKTLEEVKHMQLADMEKLLGTRLLPTRVKCAMLGLSALQAAL